MMATAPRVPVDQIERLEAALRRHETLWQIVGCLEDIGLPDCWLVARGRTDGMEHSSWASGSVWHQGRRCRLFRRGEPFRRSRGWRGGAFARPMRSTWLQARRKE